MARSNRNVPVGASLLKRAVGTITEPCENQGKQVTVELFGALQSFGWRSDYSAVATRHLVIRVAGKTSWAKQYSGARLALADTRYEKAVSDLRRYVTFEPVQEVA